MTTTTHVPSRRQMLNKVPEVTLYFWLIKVLCTTVGETFADNLNDKLKLGLTNTTYIMGALLVVSLVFQFRARRYVPGLYWLAVVLISVVGTLITDNLTDNLGVSLVTTTIVFSIVLALVFAGWYASEKTLSIHSISTMRREAWYWLAILFTFALGTAAGDLTAEKLDVGYWRSGLLFAFLIAVITTVHYALKGRTSASAARHTSNAVLAFWLAYILTRPLGASIGDFLSQPTGDGGLGLGTVVTSAIFLSAILLLVIYLTVTHTDEITTDEADETDESDELEPATRVRS
ncbi:MAG: COG4705 family protein [Actinomycetes bacterium]